MGHLAGLDGVRGLAVLAVVVFHLWPHRLPAGFLGVSLFFTLSGYLITRLLLAEQTVGTLSLTRFWGRRLRRLAPASVATLVAVTLVWWAAGWWTTSLRGDVLAGVAQVANWRQIVVGDQYGVDATASPLLHLWSLGIEEQVYLLVPVLVLAAGTARRVMWGHAGLLGVAVVSTAVHAGDATVTYYGTHVRMGEVAVGGLIAAIVHRRHQPGGQPQRWLPVLETVGGAVAVACGVGLAATMATTSLSTSAYTRGGLLAVALMSGVVVAGVVRFRVLGRAVDVAPLRWLGHRSYGIYLVHWPVLVALRRADVAASMVPWLTVVATLILADASLRWFETPIRRRRWGSAPRRVGVPAAATLVCIALIIPAASTTVVDVEAGQRELERRLPPTTVTPTTITPTTVTPTTVTGATETTTTVATLRPVRWGIVGDSKALALALGLTPAGDPRVDLGALVTGLGCPLGRGGRVRDQVGAAPYEPLPECDWSVLLDPAVAERGPVDVMLVYFGSWDVRERQVGALGSRWTTFPDPDYLQWLGEEADLLHRMVLGRVATTVQWLTVPSDPDFDRPERFDAYNTFARQQAAHNSGCVGTIDLAQWFATDDHARWALPDGIHTTWEPDGGTSRRVGDAFLVDALTSAVTAAQAAGCATPSPDRPPSPLLPDRE